MFDSFFVHLTATTATDTTAALIGSVLPMVLLLLVFYFIIMRPQKKKEKETQLMRENIQVGDEITTIGGIVGIVVRKGEDNVVIETGGDRSKLRIKLWAVQENTTALENAKAAAAEDKKSKKSE